MLYHRNTHLVLVFSDLALCQHAEMKRRSHLEDGHGVI